MTYENALPDSYEAGPSRSSGLYVDVENLDVENRHSDGQAIINKLVDNWPDKAPLPSRLSLYVRADQVELWQLWAASRFSHLDVLVKGTQHFSLSSSKNSADIAIATNAMADLTLKRVTHVVVLSDDSDFMSLYAAIRDEPEISPVDGKPPFLWVVTNRVGSLSTTVKAFFPPDQLHVVAAGPAAAVRANTRASSTPRPPKKSSDADTSNWGEMAQVILEEIPSGSFKSTDCQPIIKERWPQHLLANAGGPKFGIEFKTNVWPILESMGAKIENPGRKPIRYLMTAEAKASLSRQPDDIND